MTRRLIGQLTRRIATKIRPAGLSNVPKMRLTVAGLQMVGSAMPLKRACAILGLCMVYFSPVASASQQTPEDLARLWIEAIKANSTEKIRPLIHPACPQNTISPQILARMVQGGLPEAYVIETRELGSRAELEKVYQVVPDKQLNISYRTATAEDKAKYGLGKGFPIAKASGEWFFVICVK